MIFEPQVVKVDVVVDDCVTASVSEDEIISASADVVVTHAQADYYDGEYAITPQAEEIVLGTKDKLMSEDVVIAPIPNNYGLITWDGATLTVS